MNAVALLGRLTTDPELKQSNGKNYVSLSLAVNRPKAKDGTHATDYIECIFWNKKAEVVAKYCKRGHRLNVVGTLRTSDYQRPDGTKVHKTAVLVNELHFIESSSSVNSTTSTEVQSAQTQPVEPKEEDPFASFGQEVIINESDLPWIN